MWCRRLRLIDIVTQSVIWYCYFEHTYVFIYVYFLIRSAQTNIAHLSNKQQTPIWEVPLASIKWRILFWYMNELVKQELDTVHLDTSSHQSIVRKMKTSVTTESKWKKREKKQIKRKKNKLREKKLCEHLSCNGSNDKNRTATETLSNRTDPTFPCMC
jgi:hypothetical protein